MRIRRCFEKETHSNNQPLWTLFPVYNKLSGVFFQVQSDKHFDGNPQLRDMFPVQKARSSDWSLGLSLQVSGSSGFISLPFNTELNYTNQPGWDEECWALTHSCGRGRTVLGQAKDSCVFHSPVIPLYSEVKLK